MKISEIKNWMIKYNMKDLFLWIQTTAIHPNNQQYQTRFEILIGILFSINEKLFKKAPLPRNEFKNFIHDFEIKSNNHFQMLEDWEPFSQVKKIPFFFDRKKFYFFYGLLERPYELLRHFKDFYLINGNERSFNELNLLKHLFLTSLEFQTNLINSLDPIDEIRIEVREIYIPSQDFFDKISILFKIEDFEISELNSLPKITPGSFNDDIDNFEMIYTKIQNLNTFYIKISNEYYFLIPQNHIEILYNIAKELISKSRKKDQIELFINESLTSSIKKEFIRFFGIKNILSYILQKDTNRNLVDSIDLTIDIDNNKILLIKIVKYSCNDNLNSKINNILDEMQNTIEEIKKEEIIELFYMLKNPLGVLVEDLEFWRIVIFDDINFNYNNVDLNTWVVNSLDLKGIFEVLIDPIFSPYSLINYLKADIELLNNLKIYSAEYLDRFIYYFKNNESYLITGKIPNIIIFDPHLWHNYYQERLFDKFQDDIYELIEKDFPNEFNLVKRFVKNIYNVIETGWLNGGLAIKFEKNLIWIMFPINAITCTDDEVKGFSEFVGPLFAYYLNYLKTPLIKFFKENNFQFNIPYRICLYPAKLIKRKDEYKYFRRFISTLDEKTPIKIYTNEVCSPKIIKTGIFYDFQNLFNLFQSNQNLGERECLKLYIKSLVKYFNKDITETEADKISDAFINKNIPIGKKKFYLVDRRTENPKLNEYGGYIKLSKFDISKVNREIAQFLVKNKVKPGKYSNKEAKKLNNSIFKFLQEKLEDEIKLFDKNLLFFAYRQLELIEGQRELYYGRLGFDASRYIEYDLVEKTTKLKREISALAGPTKYLIETILKSGLKGKKIINKENWNYLQAIAVVLLETSTISDYIHYDIAPHSLEITNQFEIKDIIEESFFNSEDFFKEEVELEIYKAKSIYQLDISKKKPIENNRRIKIIQKYLPIINKGFKLKFNFSFANFMNILKCLGSMDLFDEKWFPLTIVPEEYLIEKIKKTFGNQIDDIIIIKILKFLSIDFSTYNSIGDFLPYQLLRRRERLNLCPLIILNDNKYLYGNQMCLLSLKIWMNSIFSGDSPYKISKNDPIKDILTELHNILDDELEKMSKEIAKNVLGAENIEAKIRNFKRLNPSFSRRPSCGEIDLLAVNKSTKTIFVLDAKNRSKKIRPYDIKLEMEIFISRKNSYLYHLSQKEKFVKDNLLKILNHFSINSLVDWKVRKGFIVNTVYPAAYIPVSEVDFILIKDLKNYLLE